MMSRGTLRWIDAAIILAAFAIAGGLYVAYARPDRPTLVVWSCGGNYHSLDAFSRRFEEKYDCRVRYTAAPVQYLLEEIAFEGGSPDVIVGRAGPGWLALEELDKLEGDATFFAADPYVIITPAGNPAGIEGLLDLGKPGVRVASSPRAMRPKGKCPGHLMGMVATKFFPGLDERWENNFVVSDQCARGLPEPVMNGEADAAIVAHSMLAYPGVDPDALEVVPIAVEHLDAMSVCRATIGQCLAVLREARQPDLARRYREEMLGDLGREVLEQYAYIHITSPDVQEWDPFLKVSNPKRQPPWQVHLGDRLAAEGLTREAVRRYMKVIHTFGPNEFEALCRWRIGELLAEQGQTAAAAEQWRLLIEEYPRPGPNEWGSPVFDLISAGPELNRQPDEYYVEKAREALEELPDAGGEEPNEEQLAIIAATWIDPPRVIDGDPPKNGTRELALGEDLFSVGEYDYATRDLLKVLHVCYPSRFRPAASLRLGACAYMRGRPEIARRQWEWTVEQFPDTDAARHASAALSELGSPPDAAGTSTCPVKMPPWEPTWDTWADRGMSYGMALYEHGLPLFTLKEMVKLQHAVYQKHKLGAQARYRAGIAAWEAGHPGAGIIQWRLCAKQHAQTPWGERSRQAIEAALQSQDLSAEERAEVEAAADGPLPEVPKRNKPPCWQRFSLGQEFLMVGVLDEGQAALEFLKAATVTRAAKGKYDESVAPKAEEGARRSL